MNPYILLGLHNCHVQATPRAKLGKTLLPLDKEADVDDAIPPTQAFNNWFSSDFLTPMIPKPVYSEDQKKGGKKKGGGKKGGKKKKKK